MDGVSEDPLFDYIVEKNGRGVAFEYEAEMCQKLEENFNMGKDLRFVRDDRGAGDEDRASRQEVQKFLSEDEDEDSAHVKAAKKKRELGNKIEEVMDYRTHCCGSAKPSAKT